MTYITTYGNRTTPLTVETFAPVLSNLFESKNVVSLADMRKATGRKWVHGYLAALNVARKIVAVRSGRKIVGYRFEDKPLVATKNGTIRGPKGTFVKVNASALPKAEAVVEASQPSSDPVVTETVAETPVVQEPIVEPVTEAQAEVMDEAMLTELAA